jgi:6,7-dimethyl-8-ribityllumazine synthase
MPITIAAPLDAKDFKFAIVVSRFNSFITDSLLKGSIETLTRLGAKDVDITVAYVPGSFELSLAAKKMAETKKFDAIITLGAVIKGATAHFDLVCSATASSIANASLQTGMPIIFGVITTDTIEQAIERAGTKAGNKGSEAALAAVEMIQLLNNIQS